MNPVCLSRRLGGRAQPGLPVMQFNAPSFTSGPIPARFFGGPCGPFSRPRTAPFWADKPSPAASTGWTEWSFRNPFGRPAGTQNTLAPNRRKLGQVRYARQGLVRVPESNTKYGGKRGITGGRAAPVMAPSISESSEIPKRKKLFRGLWIQAAPAVHRASIYSPSERIALWRLT